jgi:hypothetical protein
MIEQTTFPRNLIRLPSISITLKAVVISTLHYLLEKSSHDIFYI